MTDTNEARLRQELIDACRAMNGLGINRGTSGNISVRIPDGILISPSGIPYEDLTPDLIVKMDLDGNFEGDTIPSSEWPMHTAVLRARPDFNALVHTHSTHATALSVLKRDIPPLHYLVAAAGGDTIRCSDYATFGTPELGERIIEAMQDRRACLLAHHGVLTGHKTLAQALSLAVTVEELARLMLLCLPMGDPPLLSAAQMAEVLAKIGSYGQQPKKL